MGWDEIVRSKAYREMTWKPMQPLTCEACGKHLGMDIPVNTADDFNALRAQHLINTHVCSPRQLRDTANRPWEEEVPG